MTQVARARGNMSIQNFGIYDFTMTDLLQFDDV